MAELELELDAHGEPVYPDVVDALGNVLAVGDVIGYTVVASSTRTVMVGVIKEIEYETWRGTVVGRLKVYRRNARALFAYQSKVTQAIITEVDKVLKIPPEQYNEAVAAVLAAREAHGG